MQLKQLAATCLLVSTAAFAQAKPIWQDFSLTGLYGENYEVVDEKQTTLTVEYAAKVNMPTYSSLWIVCVVVTIIKVPISNFLLV
jgi:hypothetical protein